MALPTTMELPTYCVYREIQPDGSVDLAAPLHFFPPLGSDELFDALRSKFPHLKSHSERVGQASMQFFLEEDLSQFPTPLAPPSSTNVSPWEPSLPSFGSETSAWSSPDAFDPATPHSSPLSHPLSRQQSMATSATAPTSATPPALERMTSVFTLADYPQPKQHVRRKMTDQEKADYRQRRLAKACEKCAKRKRKCTHTHEGIEVASLKTAKVVKPNAASLKKSAAPKLPKIQDADDWAIHRTTDFGCPPSHGQSSLFDESGLQLSDSSSGLDFDDLLAPLQSQWPWSDTPDWTLLDPTQDASVAAHGHTPQCRPNRSSTQPFALFDQPEPTWQGNPIACADGENSHGREPQLCEQTAPSAEASVLYQPCVNPTLLHDRCNQQDTRHAGSPDCQDDIPHVYRKRRANGHAGVDELLQGTQRLIETAADGRSQQRSPSLAVTTKSHQPSETLERLLNHSPQSEGESHRRDTRNVRGLGLVSAPGSSRGMLQQNSSTLETRTLGEGITSSVDPRTQLYMLKRRIPNALHSIVDRDNSGSSMTAGPTLQVIPREQTSPEQQCVRAETGIAAGVNGPVHTRPRAASVSGFAAGSAMQQQQGICEESRLSDHVRRRDHFGRGLSFGLQAFRAMAGLACLLALWSRFASLDASLSMALLALCVGPALESKGSERMGGVSRFLPALLTA